MPDPVSVTRTLTKSPFMRRHIQNSAASHRVLRIQEQIQKHLLQSPGVALNRGQILVQVRICT